MCACEAIGSNDTLVLLGDPRQDESLVHFYGLEQEGIVCLHTYAHICSHAHTQAQTCGCKKAGKRHGISGSQSKFTIR